MEIITYQSGDELLLHACIKEHTDTSMSAIVSPSRKRYAVEWRFIMMHIIREAHALPLKKIGEIFGGRDHSSVIHAIDTVKGDMYTLKYTERLVKKLQGEYYNKLKGTNRPTSLHILRLELTQAQKQIDELGVIVYNLLDRLERIKLKEQRSIAETYYDLS